MVRLSAVIAALGGRRAPIVGAVLLVTAAVGIAGLPVPISSAGVVAETQPAAVGSRADGAGSGGAGGSGAGPEATPAAGGSLEGRGRRAADVSNLCRGGPRGVAPAPVVHHGDRNAKVVALTFDDGWGGKNLERIVRILRNARVNATFFPTGQAIRHDPETWRMIAALGYPIADHTFDHRELASLCYASQLQELRHARSVVLRTVGVTPLAVMRPPGGQYDDMTQLAATSAGEQRVVLWDVDTRDWSGVSAHQIAATALSGRNGSIVLMHTYPPQTTRALKTIIRWYGKRGYTFVTIGQLLGIPGSVPFA